VIRRAAAPTWDAIVARVRDPDSRRTHRMVIQPARSLRPETPSPTTDPTWDEPRKRVRVSDVGSSQQSSAVTLALGLGLALAACGSAAARDQPVAVDASGLCVTRGSAAIGARVTEPTMRAVKLDSAGDAATLTFVYRGDSDRTRALASGAARRQLGLKLRAQDGCNLVYVMWRLDPQPMLDVSIKRNPGAHTHDDCGTRGYQKLRPSHTNPLPALAAGDRHTLRAEIASGELRAFIDDQLAWRGPLPAAARSLAGPAGLRSDNLAFDLVAFVAPAGHQKAPRPKCSAGDGD
jgi:hypothetical protein